MSRHRDTSTQTGPGSGRGRSIRASLITLAVVPATAMVLLWVSGSFALFDQWHRSNTVGQAAKTTYALQPAIGEFQKERQLTVGLLASHGSRTALEAQRRRTDALLAGFRTADAASSGAGSAQYKAQLATVRKRIGALTAERTAVDAGKSTRQQAYAVYSDAVSSALNLFGMLSTDSGDAATAADAGHALAFLRGTEALSQEEAILGGVAASGKLSVQERSSLAAAEAVRVSVLSNEVEPYLSTEMGAALEQVMGGRDWEAMAAFETAVASASAGHDGTIAVPHTTAARAAAPARVTGGVQAVEGQFLYKVTGDSQDRTHQVLVKALLGSALALVAVLAVALLSWRITRSLLGRMSGLRAETLELAEERLPELITRLRTQGKRAELDDLPELDYGTDELGKVAEAFNSAQRTAVSVALEQASLREGARLVFHNMSRRIQLLVHRQLTVIDSMERKEQDPQLLADLYRVDHLATRMRRNAESLTVLSGAAPRRRWKHAVPLADLLRSAVSEIEGYTRVVVEPLPPIAVLGPAVGDTIHLMAELIENGVTFSPPHTEVRVRALPVAQGYAVEVEDRGLGLAVDEYAAANELLHHPKDFSFTTLGEDPRLGLFTVGHLAQRHGITASLQASSYGGSLAVVVLPQALTEPVADAVPSPLDARAERHLASVAGSPTDPFPPPGQPTGPVGGPPRAGVTAGGMPMRTRRTRNAAAGPVVTTTTPTQEATPSYGTAPTYEPAPSREPAPSYEAAPSREPAPSYDAAPPRETGPFTGSHAGDAPSDGPRTGDAPTPGDMPSAGSRTGDMPSGASRAGDMSSAGSRAGDLPSTGSRAKDLPSKGSRIGEMRALGSRKGGAPSPGSRAGETPSVGFQAGDASYTGSRTGEMRSLSPQAGDAPYTISRTGETPSVGSRTGETRSPGSQAGDAPYAGSRTGETPSAGPRTGETRSLGSQAGDAPYAGSRTGETPSAGPRAGETRSPGSQAGDAPYAGSRTGVTSSAGHRTGEVRPLGSRAGDVPSAGSRTGEMPSAGSPVREAPAAGLYAGDSASVGLRAGGALPGGSRSGGGASSLGARSGGVPGSGAWSGSGRLPRRVRQANLAPQLRDRVVEADGDHGPGREAERRPEQARSMLAALRDGTRRARAQEEVPMPAWPSAMGREGSAPGRPATPQDEFPPATWPTTPPERRQLPTRPRPTRNNP
ncbi:sensor histidine kinase [Streptomyces hokutonensis]|uniref:sensor histidine kinase n=1 Tax=Streptomyces hokutonensis TaxID=1306990 RepID=UPI00037E7552|nr:nitrate- and nitrite sensing domain-containing protein [Streptomyces hokutonensis]